jgi:hypothetical protein
MVEELQKDPSKLRLGGDRKEMTFMFMDICGFTPVSEYYKNNNDPEGLVNLINKYLDTMTKIVLQYNGTIDKYMGDCIMAFWNAPLDCEDHADKAVEAAIEISKKADELIEELEKKACLGLILVSASIQANVSLETWVQNFDSTIQSLEMQSTLPLDSKARLAITMGLECCYRNSLINSVKEEISNELILSKLKESQNRLPSIQFREPSLLSPQELFWTLQVLDIWTTYEGMKYECVYETNPLLPRKPDLNDLVTHKTKWLAWVPVVLQNNTTLTAEEKQNVFRPGNRMMIAVVFNNLIVLERVKKRENCKKIG